MEMDDIKKYVQDFFQDGTVTIIGSGLSIAEGLPSMGNLAAELKTKMTTLLETTEDREIWTQITEHLDRGLGLEQTLHEVEPTRSLEQNIRLLTANYIRSKEEEALKRVILKNESFRLSAYLKRFNIRSNDLTIITTNYDRLVEYSCELVNLRVDNLFVGKYFSKYLPSQSKYSFCVGVTKGKSQKKIEYAPKIRILKPHGCLSWYLVNDEPVSAPMMREDNCLIITPGANKYREGYNVPFDSQRAKANEAIDSAERFIIIGYGFSDDHLETHLRKQISTGKPTLLITHTLSEKANDIVKNFSNVLAFTCDTSGTKILNCNDEAVNVEANFWDIREMVREVFNEQAD
ncbi:MULTISPECIES: SIR2 family protein [unclassified Enterococcus]|uniref:SIR2 family protein n=1 Tax=unclassified Enterococcus TaxID=2608891 RepID=UPI001904A6E0|nr:MULTISPECIES: SIR2 family protein [unclassified Enterococcus]MBK0039270.1 SIR2 family protein [Enterococcus sp. S52]MBK0071956.1 SIR2 family protein [Enterococcus sp. S53]MBK0142547.1 SIR2 family protein [Enterococcus sp. S76]MBK0145700.1 SIR2 family protein [Enterococcus sp. S77]